MEYFQVIESFSYGSAKSVKQLCSILKSEGRVTVFYGKRDGTELELLELDDDIEWIEMPGKGVFKHISNIVFLRKFIKKEIKVIHGHSTFGGIYVKFSTLRNAKFSPMAKRLYSPRGYSFLREDLPRTLRKLFYFVEKYTSKMAITVACGPSEKKISVSLGGDVVQINNSLQVPEKKDDYNSSGPVLSVGRICHQKGFDIFLSVASQMPNRTFVWIGSCDAKNKKLLDILPENVMVLDAMPHDQLLNEIKGCSLMFLPSRWEGLSRVLLETLVSGRPIVTSKFPSNVDCLAREGEGFLNGFSCGSVAEYIDSIDEVLNNPAKSLNMANASRSYALSDYEFSKVKQQWLDLYSD